MKKKIKSFIKSMYFLFLIKITNYNSSIVLEYLKHQKDFYSLENINKYIKIRFIADLFFIPKAIHFAQMIQRSEKEGKEIETIHEILSNPTTIIDIGANIGYWTFARNYFLKNRKKFYCFEPSSFNFFYLKKNLKKFNNIELINLGLSNYKEKKTLSFPHWENRITDTGLLSLHGNSEVLSEKVQLITLDSYFNKRNTAQNIFIKIDVEGHEFEIIEGGQKFLSQNHSITIQTELNFDIEINIKKNNIQKLIKLLKNLNFKTFIYIDFSMKKLSDNDLNSIVSRKINSEIFFIKNLTI